MQDKIAIIGLGYVGLPLAHAFSDKYDVVGIDINEERISELNSGIDRTLELTEEQAKESILNGLSNGNPVIIDVKGIVENPTWRL